MAEKILQMSDAVSKLAIKSPETFLDLNPPSSPDLPRKKSFIETAAYDADGELISKSLRSFRSQNGSGFVISYTEKMCEFLEKVSSGSIVRVFLYIAQRQAYGNDGRTFGYKCSHKYLYKILNLDRSTLWDALKFLKENYLVHVAQADGAYEFMVNPNYVTIGSDKKTRWAEWNRRWAQTFKEAQNNGK